MQPADYAAQVLLSHCVRNMVGALVRIVMMSDCFHRVRKVDNRKCLRNHEGKSKLININIIFNGDDSSGDDSLMDPSDQENIHNTCEEFGDERVTRHVSGSVGNVITPAAVATSGVKAGRDSRQISKKWWNDHKKSVQDLNLENDKLKEEATR